MKNFDEISRSLEALPTIPIVVSRVLRVVEDSASSANDLVDIIQNDQAICSKVLRVANSAYYGLRQQVTTIGHAVVLLGFETVRNLCLGVGVFRSFLPYAQRQVLDIERFWEHTIASGVCARMLWEEQGWPGADEVFLAGLIHDIGRLAFLAAEPKGYTELIQKARKDAAPMVEVEREEMGGTHAELGALLCERWDFGPGLVEPVHWHHDPGESGEEFARRAAGVALGNCLSHRRRIGWAVDALPPDIPQAALDRLELTSEQADALADRLENRRTEIESFTEALM
ncbi:MAG TPA: HDOD domain-containing protein [Planctomycetota bacterium]|nr:HDOD domain-containing protein [Planctomycetota bacterium]